MKDKLPEKLKKYYLKEYCFKCGKRLIYKNKRFHGYSSETGEAEYIYVIACPNDSWFNRILSWAFHERHDYLLTAPSNSFGLKNHQTVLEKSSY
jgi:hypothetical protein